MKIRELDEYIRGILDIDGMAKADYSLNGLQVGSLDNTVTKVSFAVDACMESFKRAAAVKAGLLFVHHGLFWGKPVPLVGTMYDRIRFLTAGNLALYAAHLPLDMHPDLGNNAALARTVGLSEISPFGEYKGADIGFKGVLGAPSDIDGILRRLSLDRTTATVLPFGPREIRTVGVVSGGAAMEVSQAIDARLDLYITGEAEHSIYHLSQEAGINVIAGGHYHTETGGVRALAEKMAADTELETVFIDVPTGM